MDIKLERENRSCKVHNETEFGAESFEFLYDIEDRNFWFKNRRELIYKFISAYIPNYASKKMLEVGCGTGNVLHYLNEKGIDCDGADLFFEGLTFARRRTSKPLYQIDVRQMPFNSAFDIIGLFDVLEHITEDGLVVRNIFNALKPGGYLILTVPTLNILWSETDVVSFHKRRYRLSELEKLLTQNGFSTMKRSYFIFFLLPIVFFLRRAGSCERKKQGEKLDIARRGLRLNPILNTIFYFILRLEQWIVVNVVDLPIGSSCIVLAQKIER